MISTSLQEWENRLLQLEEAQRRWEEKLSRLENTLRHWQQNLRTIDSLSQLTVITEGSVLEALAILLETNGLDERNFEEHLGVEAQNLLREFSYLQQERRQLEAGIGDHE